jgi:O-antigen/teichoic acid export membrane protein
MSSVQHHPSYRPSGHVLRSIGHNLGWLVGSRGVVAVLSLLYLGIAARTLGIEGFGRFSLIAGAAQALATLVAFQSWQLIVQFGVGLSQGEDEPRLARLFRGSAVLDLSSALIGAGLAVVILELWSDAFGIGATLKRAALIYTVVQLVTIRSAAVGILRLRDKFRLAAIADSITPIARTIGATLVMIFHPTVQAFLAVWAVAEVLTSATYWIMVSHIGDLKLVWSGKGFKRMLEENDGILRFALSTNASSTLALASKQVPLLAVGNELGVAAAGTFRLAAQLAQSLGKIGQLISRAAFPEIVRAVQDAKDKTVRMLVLRTVVASTAAGAGIMLIAVFFGKSVLKLVGGHVFGQGHTVLVWMAAAGAIDLVAVGLDTVLTARGYAGRIFLIRIASVAIMLGVALVTLPRWGEVGMAAAVVAGSVTVTSLLFAITYVGNKKA